MTDELYVYKCMKLAWSLKYGFWYSIYSAVVKYSKVTAMIGQKDNPSCESQANLTHYIYIEKNENYA